VKHSDITGTPQQGGQCWAWGWGDWGSCVGGEEQAGTRHWCTDAGAAADDL